MRNKQQNNEGFISISKGGVLYREGELPVLSKDQIDLARIVNQLPHDFPIVNWESMNTKQQLHAMKFSGLNEKEQWSLLNSSVPLIVLDRHNQVQNRIEIAALAARTRATPGKSTNSTSLQTTAQQRKLDMKQEEYETRFYEKQEGRARVVNTPNDSTKTPDGEKPIVDSRDEMEQKKDKRWEKTESTYNPREAMDREKDEMWGMVNGNPLTYPAKPAATPLPQPGPSPVATPDVDNETNSFEESPPIELTARDKQILLGLLNMDKNLMSVSDRKVIELVERQVQKGDITENQLNRYYNEVTRIRDKVMKVEWVNKVKDHSDDTALWGIGLINDQSIYSDEPGSFGVLGNLKNNGCGLVAMNNANYHLGLNIRYDDFIKEMQGYSNLATNAFGLLGMNPDMIGTYNHLGAEVTTYNFPINIPTDHDAYIIMYIYTSGAHYVEAQYDKVNNCYKVYNTGVSDDVATIPDLTPAEYRSYEKNNRRIPTPIIHWVVWGIDAPLQPMVDIPGSAVEENY